MHSTSPNEPISPPLDDLIHFACAGCGMPLSVPFHMAGVSGPCPQCGEVVAAPASPLVEWRNITSVHRSVEPYAGPLPSLPQAGRVTPLSRFDLVLRSSLFRLSALAVLLVAPALYYAKGGAGQSKAPLAQAPALRLKHDPIVEDATSGTNNRYRMLNGKDAPGMHTAADFIGAGNSRNEANERPDLTK